MNLATVIASLALIIIVGLALWYIIKEKKKGNKCVGCPYAGECCKYSSKELDEKAAEISAGIAAENASASCCGHAGK